jgi:transcriptional regulator with XRE-family HTH domain
MNEQLQQIGCRIKDLREIAGITINELAEELQIDGNTLTEYENGISDIPVGFLTKISQKFHVPLATLISGEDPKLHIYSIVRNGKGLQIQRRKQYKYESLAFNFIDKKAEPFMVTIEPKDDSIPVEYNSHPGQEFDYVVSGQMKFYIHKHEIILYAGDSIYFDSGYPHAMRAMNNTSVKMLVVVL